MTALTHVTAGRTALKALLVAVALTTGIAGTAGTVAAEPTDGIGDDPHGDDLFASLDGKGNDPLPSGLYASLDGKGNDVYPPPGLYASLDGKGNDVYPPPGLYASREAAGAIDAFPIDNVTLLAGTHYRPGDHFSSESMEEQAPLQR
jgi:hypothetical protein